MILVLAYLTMEKSHLVWSWVSKNPIMAGIEDMGPFLQDRSALFGLSNFRLTLKFNHKTQFNWQYIFYKVLMGLMFAKSTTMNTQWRFRVTSLQNGKTIDLSCMKTSFHHQIWVLWIKITTSTPVPKIPMKSNGIQ